jgi:hypothetical protein
MKKDNKLYLFIQFNLESVNRHALIFYGAIYFIDIIIPVKGNIWTARGDPKNYKLFQMIPLS